MFDPTTLPSPKFCKFLLKLLSGRSRVAHKNVEGAVHFTTAEVQIMTPDYHKAISTYFNCVDDSFERGKFTRAYTFKPIAIETMEYVLYKCPEYLGKYKRDDSGKKKYFEHYSMPAINRLLSENNFKQSGDRLFLKYLQLSCSSDGVLTVTYSQRAVKARRFADGPSLQGCPNYLRFQINAKAITDIDLGLAHPTIILGLLKRVDEDADCPALESYVGDREFCVSQIIKETAVTREAAKTLFNMVVYGASLSLAADWSCAAHDWIKKSGAQIKIIDGRFQWPEIIYNISKELKDGREKILALPEFKEIFDGAENRASCLALAVSMVENDVLSLMEAFFEYKGKTVSTLLFDGLHLQGRTDKTEIKELEKGIKARLLKTWQIDCDMKLKTTEYGAN
jgi:hypothetical protein